jgi:Acetyltransferase (GNAT) family.
VDLELTYTLGDLDAASALLVRVAQDRVERGEELWPPRSLTPERLERYYPRPGWRVAWHGGEAVGTYVLLDADPLFWPDDPPGEAAYLHKLSVHPGWQGRGLSHTLLEHAAAEACALGRSFLRLDTAAERPRLRALYAAAGFREVDVVQAGSWRVARFERRLTAGPLPGASAHGER